MNLKFVKPENISDLFQNKFDYLICASGYESRGSYFYFRYKNLIKGNPEKLCFVFSNTNSLSSIANLQFYKDNNFELIISFSEDLAAIVELAKNIFKHLPKNEVKILIDYSCMTKVMYAGFVKYFAIANPPFETVSIYFSYTPAVYHEPQQLKSPLYNQLLPLFNNIGLTDKKIALIVNLGFEFGKAKGLIDYWEISNEDVYLFYPNMGRSDPYRNAILKSNRYLLKKTPEQNHFSYNFQNTSHILTLLESLCSFLLAKNYRVVITPLGTKHFALLSILLYVKYNDLTVLRVSLGDKALPIDKIADISKDPIVVCANFSQE